MLNAITIIVSKMTSYCSSTERMRLESESGIRKWEEMWFKTTAEDEERGAAVTCDGRLFHRRAAATRNALSPTVDRRIRRTSRDVDGWGRTWSSSGLSVYWSTYLVTQVRWRPTMLTFVHQNSDLIGDPLSWSDCKRYAGMPVKVALPKSSRESTSETTIDWRTGLDTDRRILRSLVGARRRVVKQEVTDFPTWDLIDMSESK